MTLQIRTKLVKVFALQVVGVLPAITFEDVSAFSLHIEENQLIFTGFTLQSVDAFHEVHSVRYLE